MDGHHLSDYSIVAMTDANPSVLSSLAPLAATSDVWFLDIWGVVHNGVRPYAATIDACRRFRDGGGTVILVSNAPRPCTSVAAQLDRIGVPADTYDAIVSSGDVSISLVKAWDGRAMFHVGPDRDRGLFAGLSSQPSAKATDADVAVCTGLFDDERETPANYAPALTELKRRDVPMICANPDQKVERAGRLIYCAGAIAAAYEAIGGKVDYAGKPYLPIYDVALETAAGLRGHEVSRERVIAIGDGIATDIAGAANFGIRSIYIASGVHVELNETIEAAAARLFKPGEAQRPIAVMRELTW